MQPSDSNPDDLRPQPDAAGSSAGAFELYRFGPFVLDARRWLVERAGEEIPLQPKVFKALLYLLQRPGVMLSKEKLIADLWPGAFVTDGVLTRCINQLRAALGDDARDPQFIRTASRVGYAFVAEVTTGGTSRVVEPTSLAVLPFRPHGGSVRDEALELGLADGLVKRLSKLRHLNVRPLSSVGHYDAPDRDVLAAAREQSVDTVVDGDWQKVANDRLRVSVRALRVADATPLLAETFEVPASESQTIPEAISNKLAPTLRFDLTPEDTEQLSRRDTDDPNAYRCYLLGRLRANLHTPEDERASIKLFDEAVTHDPRYALAWAALADSQAQLGTLETDFGHYDIARRHALRALELQPDLVPALTCLGNIAWLWDWDWGAAEGYFKRGLSLGTGDAEIYISYSDFCCYVQRSEEAIDAAARALEIDPGSPYVNALLAQALHMAGLHAEAVAQARRALAIAPDFAFAHLFAGLASLMRKRYLEGIEHMTQARGNSSRSDFAAAVGLACGLAGQHDEARRILREIKANGEEPRPIDLALVHFGLGEHEESLDWLERAFDDRDWHVLLLHAEPVLRPLRDHPRAGALLERIQLPS